jgi:hypothetical protein
MSYGSDLRLSALHYRERAAGLPLGAARSVLELMAGEFDRDAAAADGEDRREAARHRARRRG